MGRGGTLLTPIQRRDKRRALRASAGVISMYVLIAIALGWPVWLSPNTHYIGVGGDPLQTMWFLAWTPHAIAHMHSPWLSTYMNYPNGFNVTWNAAEFLPAVVLWPVTALWGSIVSYNVLVTLAYVTSASSAYFAIRRWVPERAYAAIGGLLYGFSPYMVATGLGHLNLMLAFTPPLLLIAFDELVVRQRWSPFRAGVLLGLVAVVQFFISEEVLVLEVVGSALALATVALINRSEIKSRARYIMHGLATGAVVALALVAWPLAVQLFGPGRPGGAIQGHDIYSSDAFGFLLPTLHNQRLAPRFITDLTSSRAHHFAGNSSEWMSYIGLPLIICLVVVVLRRWRRDRTARAAAVVAVTVLIFSMGPHLHILGYRTGVVLPWFLPDKLAIVGDVLPVRFMVLAFLPIAILFAMFVSDVSGIASKTLRIGAAALAVAAMVALLPGPTRLSRATLPAGFRHLSARVPDGSVAVVLPYVVDERGYAPIGPMYWQAASGFRYRMPGGYFIGAAAYRFVRSPCGRKYVVMRASRTPWMECTFVGIERYGFVPTATEDAHVEAEMREIRPALVVVGPSRRHEEVEEFVARVLDDLSTGSFGFCRLSDNGQTAAWVARQGRDCGSLTPQMSGPGRSGTV